MIIIIIIIFIDCGGTFTRNLGMTGTISSPGFNNGTHQNREQCIWILESRLPSNSSISVKFTHLEIEQHGECMFDFVELREGGFKKGRV